LDAITEIQKLRDIDSRRKRYLESRRSIIVDLLSRMRSAVKAFAEIRDAQKKGTHRWFQPIGKPVDVQKLLTTSDEEEDNLVSIRSPIERRLRVVD
jgi:hypothetical protein